MAEDNRDERLEILGNDELSADEKDDQLQAPGEEPESDLAGDTIEGVVGGIASRARRGARHD